MKWDQLNVQRYKKYGNDSGITLSFFDFICTQMGSANWSRKSRPWTTRPVVWKVVGGLLW